jgi:hypothetical protein
MVHGYSLTHHKGLPVIPHCSAGVAGMPSGFLPRSFPEMAVTQYREISRNWDECWVWVDDSRLDVFYEIAWPVRSGREYVHVENGAYNPIWLDG